MWARNDAFNGDNTDRILKDVRSAHLPAADLQEINEALTRASVGAFTLSGRTVGEVITDERDFDNAHRSDLLAAMHWYARSAAPLEPAIQDLKKSVMDAKAGNDDAVFAELRAGENEAEAASTPNRNDRIPYGWNDVADLQMRDARDLSTAMNAVQNCPQNSTVDECLYNFTHSFHQAMRDLHRAQWLAEQHYRQFGRRGIDSDVQTCIMAAVVEVARKDPTLRRKHKIPSVRYPRGLCGPNRGWLPT